MFWTTVVPESAVSVDLGAGTAVLQVEDIHPKDYGNLENAVLGTGNQPVPAVVSFRVEWTADGPVNAFNNADEQFRGSFRNAAAQMEWTARTPDFEFRSAALSTSEAAFAELGEESNGSFY